MGRSKKKKAQPISTSSGKQLEFAEVATWEIPPTLTNSVEIGTLPSPIWTETKAQLIRNYLRLFLLITKHGTYIDGFAGQQDRSNPESWAAKLVVELSPAWMREFFLCEIDRSSYADLRAMLKAQPNIRNRKIHHRQADFNVWIDDVLASGGITEKTAAFALLDQRSKECHWSTVQKLASHKRSGTKIELFYFFPTGWVHRFISETQDKSTLDTWWGDEGWKRVDGTTKTQAALLFLARIQSLGYRDVKMWPISSEENGEGRTMYHMIHATDHPEAPKLMYRAYKDLTGIGLPAEQSAFDFPAPDDGSH